MESATSTNANSVAGVSPGSTHSTTQPTAQPTSRPTQVTSKPTIGSQVVVGGTEDAFNAKFGNPTSQKMTQNGVQELFYDTGNSNIGGFGVVLIPNTKTIFGI